MKRNNPKYIALQISIFLSIIYTFSISLYFGFSSGKINWMLFFASIMVFGAVSYIIIWQALENFIYRKIRILYKTILNQKLSKQKIKLTSDWLENAENDVLEWAEDQQKEVENLKKLEAYRRNFLGNVSHELKTPIFNIQGYILTLLDGGLEDVTINREYLSRAEKSVDRMISIVKQLDEISKLESEMYSLHFERFDIHALSKELIELFQPKALQKNIQLFINLNTVDNFMVYADKELIKQAMSNLIDNSIKYGTENGRTKISFYDMDEVVLVEVSDNGIGIKQEDLPRIFERFYRTNYGKSHDNSGSGLGLAIVKHIIEAHHQTINVRSNLGFGSTFGFTLKKA